MSFVYQGLMRLWDALWRSLGLAGKQGNLLVLGLDNAGKTTLLYTLQTGEQSRSFPPTDRPTLNSFQYGSIAFTAWDLGGHEAVRHLWEDYFSEQVSAVLFLIDAADSARLEEAAYELDALIGEKILPDIPVALLLNKCDIVETAMTTQEVCERIEYNRLAAEHGGEIAIFRISVLQREGYQAAFRWVASFLK